jgi:hypothetical protein
MKTKTAQPETVKRWRIRCLCGQTYDGITQVTCTCGAKLTRTGSNCCAYLPAGYDRDSKPHGQASAYQVDVQVW